MAWIEQNYQVRKQSNFITFLKRKVIGLLNQIGE